MGHHVKQPGKTPMIPSGLSRNALEEKANRIAPWEALLSSTLSSSGVASAESTPVSAWPLIQIRDEFYNLD
jgi:hypothetical protein